MAEIKNKNGQTISNVKKWFELAPPKEGKKQWKDGRSAKETAKAWLRPSLPNEIIQVLKTHPDFSEILDWSAVPEFESKFDDFSGPANIDLMLFAKDDQGDFIVGIESKADESFSTTLSKTYKKAEKALIKSPNSKRVKRIEQLVIKFLGKKWEDLSDETELRYQLFTGLAATIAEANRNEIDRAVFLIHEFVTDQTKDKNHERNQVDLDAFVNVITDGAFNKLEAGDLVPLNKDFSANESERTPKVYIAKVKTILRK